MLMTIFSLLSVFFYYADKRQDEAAAVFFQLKKQDFYTSLRWFQAKWFLKPVNVATFQTVQLPINSEGWPAPHNQHQCEALWQTFISIESFKLLESTQVVSQGCRYQLLSHSLVYESVTQHIRTD